MFLDWLERRPLGLMSSKWDQWGTVEIYWRLIQFSLENTFERERTAAGG